MRIEVLDHGYVEFIEAWGRGKTGNIDYECGIIEAARQSTQGSFRGWDQDTKLLKRLWLARPEGQGYAWPESPRHATPFEFAGMIIEAQAPIFVFREWHRHRTQSYNEMSARYAPLPDLYYHAPVKQVLARAKAALESKNKQAGSTATSINQAEIDAWVSRDLDISRALEDHYQRGLSIGVPKELARKKMPVDHYSRMRASGNLRNWLAFLRLRQSSTAQWEIRQYANAVATIIEKTFPNTYKLHEECPTS